MKYLLKNKYKLITHIRKKLTAPAISSGFNLHKSAKLSGVLFPLTMKKGRNGIEPCLILTKRAEKLKQGGDLCCPGGSISPKIDGILARLISLPISPLAGWPGWNRINQNHDHYFKIQRLIIATSLRESFEEIGLLPCGLDFLGPLPAQNLAMFKKTISPIAVWIKFQKYFFINKEVAKIVKIPLFSLLNPANYKTCRISIETKGKPYSFSTPCFLFHDEDSIEYLWGATFRITISFLELVFGFIPPNHEQLPIVYKRLKASYIKSGY